MKIDFNEGKITLVIVPVDLRYGFKRLSMLASELLQIDISKGEDWVLFFSKNRSILKIIHSDDKGNLLITRTLHTGKFQQLLSREDGTAVDALTVEELLRYLDGECIQVKRTNILKN